MTQYPVSNPLPDGYLTFGDSGLDALQRCAEQLIGTLIAVVRTDDPHGVDLDPAALNRFDMWLDGVDEGGLHGRRLNSRCEPTTEFVRHPWESIRRIHVY